MNNLLSRGFGSHLFACLLSFTFCAAHGWAAAQAPLYRVVELATSASAESVVQPTALNDNDVALGSVDGSWSILFPDGSISVLRRTGDGAYAGAINNAGNAVITTSSASDPLVWFYDAAAASLSPLLPRDPGVTSQRVVSIDDANTIVGSTLGGSASGPFVIRGGQFESLAAVLGADAFVMNANRFGVIVGLRGTGPAPYAYYESRDRVRPLAGVLGTNAVTLWAVGGRSGIGGERRQPETGLATGFVLLGRQVQDVSLPGATASAVYGMNEANDAVGAAFIGPCCATRHALLWRGGQAIDLSELPEVKASGIDVTFAVAINNKGSILAGGFRPGNPFSTPRVLLLTPVAASVGGAGAR